MHFRALLAALPVALLLTAAQDAPAPAEPQFSAERIRADVTYLADDTLEGRFSASKGYFTAAAWVANRFAKLGLTPGGDVEKWFQLFPLRLPSGKAEQTYRSANVIGIIPGSDPVLKDEYVVLSAHLDHLGMSKEPGDKIYNGAMDNASGVATMLEAARAFATSGKPPRRSILFVALGGEEEGLIGSDYLARHPVVGSGKVVADVNLDMPILLYDFQDVVAFGAEHSTLGPIVADAAAKMGVTLSPDPMPSENLFVRSDHYSFVKVGVPSIFLVTGFRNGGEKAFRSFLRSHYHQANDDVTQPFDWQAGAKFAKINYLIAREIADRDEAPRWYEGNSYGDRYAKGAPRAPRPAKP
ncbi:M28 family metallopeptidase [Sphingomonas sp. HITSZ_GF]|uniref:M28 family metallopeptidase n=1 Tax=Sphingomonas sp. HITSZ_GF TaxID=3037247 RepID=UPI0032205C30